MIRLNLGGILVLFVFLALTSYFGVMEGFFFPTLLLVGGTILFAADRLWNCGTTLSFAFSILWFGYWSYITSKTFYIVGLFAFMSSMGVSGDGKLTFLMLSAVLFIFVGLAIVNFARLFLIPKPEQKS